MSYGPKMKSPRNAGRGHETPERKKAKARSQKHRSSNRYLLEENQAPASEQVVEKTLGRLRSLGNQIFALSPFTEYFNDWLVNLKGTLSDFDSTSAISSDDQFAKECSQILSNIERDLEERRHKETAHDGAMKSLSDNRSLLERIDEESATRSRRSKGEKTVKSNANPRSFRVLKKNLLV